MKFKEKVFIACQYMIPQHGLSRLIGFLADCRISWLKNYLIKSFIKYYQVDMSHALYEKAEDYTCFNDFFTRSLKAEARPIDQNMGSVISPVDGMVSEMGGIADGKLLQAKGHHYSLVNLLGGDVKRAIPFEGGQFMTIYLSPKDYHRIHMPISGTLKEMTYVPGSLFSVNQTTASYVPELFARNERVICIFDTALGRMAVILVGAMIVASIETTWAGLIAPPSRQLKTVYYGADSPEVFLEKGEQLGLFKLGSTVIIMFEADRLDFDSQITQSSTVEMGKNIARSKCLVDN